MKWNLVEVWDVYESNFNYRANYVDIINIPDRFLKSKTHKIDTGFIVDLFLFFHKQMFEFGLKLNKTPKIICKVRTVKPSKHYKSHNSEIWD